ncbi:MAG TPA: hypothetical protein VL974_16860, partial [Magnetospirillum sp.]|nr:hypothetical protein [Magnetospirillum sp.]
MMTGGATARWSATFPRAETVLLGALLAVLAASMAYRSLQLPNHDASWFAYVAARLQEGVSFYDRFVDPNWPIAAYAMAPAGFLWRHGVDMGTAINGQTHLAAALSLLLCVGVLRQSGLPPLRQAGLLLAIAAAELALPQTDFGQREHLFIMLLLPYLVLAGLRLEGIAVPLPL